MKYIYLPKLFDINIAIHEIDNNYEVFNQISNLTIKTSSNEFILINYANQSHYN